MLDGFVTQIKRRYWSLLRERWRLSPSRLYEHWLESRFDRAYGLDTTARVRLADLSIASVNRQHGRVYAAMQIGPTRRALGSLSSLGIRYQDFTLIDLGSGKGRVLLLGAAFGFKAIVGVEFSPELTAIAAENIRRYPKPAGVSLHAVCADAAEFEIPADNCVIFMFRPFGMPVVEKVVDNIVAALRRGAPRIIVVYFWPLERAPFDRCELFRLRESGPELAIYEAGEAGPANARRSRHHA